MSITVKSHHSYHMDSVELTLTLDPVSALEGATNQAFGSPPSVVKVASNSVFGSLKCPTTATYTLLMRPTKAKTAVNICCHYVA